MTMYKHLLLAFDGSELSLKAFTHAIGIARPLQARVTAFWAAPDVPLVMVSDGAIPDLTLMQRHTEAMRERAEQMFEPLTAEAKAAGVPLRGVHTLSDTPWRAILDAAKSEDCDAIVMASHGRRGVAAVLLGSETQKVLTHASIPVLVIR
jgi:nucleotide-binding universal stress UspA family protein